MNIKYIFHFSLIAGLIYAGSLVSMDTNTHEQLFTQSLVPLPPLFDQELDNWATSANPLSTSMNNAPCADSLQLPHQEPIPAISSCQALNFHNESPQFPTNFNELLSKKTSKRPRRQEAVKLIKCELCPFSYAGKQALREHMATVHTAPRQIFKCNHCPAKVFYNKKAHGKHVRKHYPLITRIGRSGKKSSFIQCPHCTMSHEKLSAFQKHLRTYHPTDGNLLVTRP